MGNRHWTSDEVTYLEEKWGECSIAGIAKHLGRSVAAVKNKAVRLGLGAFLDSGNYITLQQLYLALGCNAGNTYKDISWVRNQHLPVSRKRVGNSFFKVIRLEDFWKWAFDHQSMIDFSRVPWGIFGAEPQWAADKRRQDKQRAALVTRKPWTQYEDATLGNLLKAGRYNTSEIARRLGRTEGAVIRRISTLQLTHKPLRNSRHIYWTEQEISTVKEMILLGANYTTIALSVERHSEKAVRGLMTRYYGTERLDEVRRIIREEEI